MLKSTVFLQPLDLTFQVRRRQSTMGTALSPGQATSRAEVLGSSTCAGNPYSS